jgi:hypothetical protein
MAAGEGPLGEDHVVAFPPAPTAGMLGVLVREGRVDEFRRLERENRVRIWRVRGVVSDHIPLCGDARSVLALRSEHNLLVNNPPLSIYLHAGGANAIFYDLVACRSEFVTADAAGGIGVFPLDRSGVGGISVDVAAEFAS